jgi:hypothetical protein
MRCVSVNRGMVLILLILLGLLTACSGLSQRSGPEVIKVESLLTVDEFRAAGLDTLEEEQLVALDRALTRALLNGGGRGVDQAALSAWEASDEDEFATFGMPDEHPAARQHRSMSSRLAADVTDWSRGREIPLSNGQVWTVAETVHSGFRVAEADTPVVIQRAAMGSFRMRLGDRNFTPRVRRVE